MTRIHSPYRWLMILLCCATTAYCQEANINNDSGMVSWKPDHVNIFTNNIQWGPETNHVKAGLSIQYSTDSANRTLVGFFVVLYNNSSTNGNFRPDLLSLLLPPTNSLYRMALYDVSGIVVAKTKMGNAITQAFDTNPKRVDIYHDYGVRDIEPFHIDVLPFDPIVLENMFVITNAGTYHLKFVLNTLTERDDQGLQPFCLPVDADIKIEKP